MTPNLPLAAWGAALAALDLMNPLRLRTLLSDGLDPEQAWACLAAGRPPRALAAMTGDDAVKQWRAATATVDPAEVWRRCRAIGLAVHVKGFDTTYPAALADDPSAPLVLFSLGDLAALDRPRAALVGTRNATVMGREIAFELGAALAEAGVTVVSGLAAGIDAACHRGALSVADLAPPVGVVGSGLDVVYPAANRSLWDAVASHGLLLSEQPPGARPMPYNFPLRNRIIAALGDPLVVVESHERGGSLITAHQAIRRGHMVMAVPGSIRSPASVGTNQLLRDGCHVLLDPLDVLVVVGLATAGAPSSQLTLPLGGSSTDRSPETSPDRWLLDGLGGAPATIDDLVERSGRDLDQILAAMSRLDDHGLITQRGPWVMPVGRPRRSPRVGRPAPINRRDMFEGSSDDDQGW